MEKPFLLRRPSSLALPFFLAASWFPRIIYAQSGLPTAVVGTNIPVSTDHNCHRMETTLAANPVDASNLLAISISSPAPDCKVVFHSSDNGQSWSKSPLPAGARIFGDPQFAFDEKGKAYLASLITIKEGRQQTTGIGMYRSVDKGFTWLERGTVPLFHQQGWDHEMIAFDRTDGPFRGRMYLFADTQESLTKSGKIDSRVVVAHSRDHGGSFSKPVVLQSSGNGTANTSNNIVVLPDGTVVIHYSTSEISADKTFVVGSEYIVTSTDGAATFSEPRKILEFRQQQPDSSKGEPAALEELTSLPSLAADSSNSKFKSRLYLAWGDWRSSRSLVWFSTSSDRGTDWSPPVKVANNEQGAVEQFQPAIAVNREGVVLISWYQTDRKSYDIYAAASVDGGRLFGPPVRVTSVGSTGSPLFGHDAATDIGDYMGLDADANGIFHLTWMDKRNGTSEIYAAQVTVEQSIAR